jgi:hypothetical protein
VASLLHGPKILKQYFADQQATLGNLSAELARFRDDICRLLNRLRLRTITGSITVSNLAIGSTVDIHVEHTADQTFRLAEPPRFTVVNGVDVQVFELIDIAGTGKATNGTGFAVRVTNVSLSAYFPSFTLNWSRIGFAL